MKKIFYLLMGIMPFFAIACNNHDDYDDEQEKLSYEIKYDLKQRFQGSEIISYRNCMDYMRKGTEVNLIDKDGNKVSVFYQDFNKLSLTMTKYSNLDKLPIKIRYAFLDTPYGGMNMKDVTNIECDDYALLPHKMYKIEFTYFEPCVGNLYTMLIFNEDGYMLLENHDGHINLSWNNPIINEDEMEFIKNNYGTDIRSFNNDAGSDSFYVLDQNVLKNVILRDEKWYYTIYPIPVDTEIPSNILEKLEKKESGFKYTALYMIETPKGYGYEFLNDKKQGYIIF